MKPEIYKEAKIKNEILLPISKLNRVGTTLSGYLTRLVGGTKIIDLLFHPPAKIENISICPKLFEAQNDELIILTAKVESHAKPNNSRQPYKIICYTPSGYLTLVFFKIFPSQLAKMPIGAEIAVLGNLKKIAGENQITHPQEILPASQINKLSKISVTYPLTGNLPQKFLRAKISEALQKLDENCEEWIDKNLLEQKKWSKFNVALKYFHYFLIEKTDENLRKKSQERLAYDELLAWQLAILLAKDLEEKTKELILPDKNLASKLLENLPFKLTNSQEKVIDEIAKNIYSNKKMLRLLQGDVGSGKTIVAIISCLHKISQNKQCCIIAPTTVLAKQHLHYFTKLLAGFDLKIAILTSATTKKQKQQILEKLENQQINILISTHAVLEDDVKFKDLGLAIIDEQHRFGVMQRLKLVEKSNDVDVLLMSATPIPRSLMMGLYGNMDISILNEKPKNRQEIKTVVMSQNRVGEIFEAIKRAIARNEKIYWICPAIEENEENDLASVETKFNELVNFFGDDKVAILHGKMKESEKEKILTNFADEKSTISILVATTVIEVGIDVSSATVIVIENSENFGLSQLHQLRGRVGRGEKPSFCILLYGVKFGAKQKERLGVMKSSNDGFVIAEEDLKMRGSGELIGTKQSGFPEFRIADLAINGDLLKIANKQAQLILQNDKKLEGKQSEKFRFLLNLFSYENCLKIINSG